MCSVVGFTSPHVTSRDLDILEKVMIESRIRGMHASGAAWYSQGFISSIVKPIPIDQLVKLPGLQRIMALSIGRDLTMIAHARYSTSDIRYNQPLVGDHLAIAHNGVISQADPKLWKKMYGYTCKTKNDSELLLRAMEAGDNPEQVFPGASIAMVALDDQGHLTAYRNGLRPLWRGKIGQGVVYGSTFSILHRAGVFDIEKVDCDTHDSQRRDWTRWI